MEGGPLRGRLGMFRQLRTVAALVALAILSLSLGGCGDEPAQRHAFIDFLQRRIIDRPGLHIPIMSEQDIKNFGPYADQYKIMNGFHHQVDRTISQDLARAMQIGTPRSIAELPGKREIFPIVRQGMAKFKAEIETAQAQADAAHAALKQPPDLKAVYDIAYSRMVSTPAAVFLDLVPSILDALKPVEELAEFLEQNRDAIEFRDGQPTSKNTFIRGRLASLMDAAAASAKASDEGRRKLRAMSEGK
jgi:hypothetical protein